MSIKLQIVRTVTLLRLADETFVGHHIIAISMAIKIIVLGWAIVYVDVT